MTYKDLENKINQNKIAIRYNIVVEGAAIKPEEYPEVKEGSFVEAGQTIAYVNQPTKYYSKEGDNIYFSVERNGKTKDPLNYIDYED